MRVRACACVCVCVRVCACVCVCVRAFTPSEFRPRGNPWRVRACVRAGAERGPVSHELLFPQSDLVSFHRTRVQFFVFVFVFVCFSTPQSLRTFHLTLVPLSLSVFVDVGVDPCAPRTHLAVMVIARTHCHFTMQAYALRSSAPPPRSPSPHHLWMPPRRTSLSQRTSLRNSRSSSSLSDASNRIISRGPWLHLLRTTFSAPRVPDPFCVIRSLSLSSRFAGAHPALYLGGKLVRFAVATCSCFKRYEQTSTLAKTSS